MSSEDAAKAETEAEPAVEEEKKTVEDQQADIKAKLGAFIQEQATDEDAPSKKKNKKKKKGK